MGMVSFLAKKIFDKIFTNLAKSLDQTVDKVQIGIRWENSAPKYEAYISFKKIKEIELDDYVGSVVDFSGGTAVVESTIAQSGPKYAKQLGVAIEDVSIIMQHNAKTRIPDAVLMNGKAKVRKIDIESEFLNN